MYTSALSASLCASGERPDDAPAPTPGLFVARWTRAARMTPAFERWSHQRTPPRPLFARLLSNLNMQNSEH